MYGCSNATASAARGGPSSSKQNNFREQQQTPLPPLCSNSDQQLNSRKPSNIEQGSSVSIMKMDSAVSLSDRKLTMTVKEWHDLCESSIAEHVEKLRVQFTSQCRKIADRIEQLEKSTISSRRSRRAKKSSKAEISKAQAVKPQLDEIKKDWDATQSILNPNRKIQIPLTTTTDSTHSTQQLLDGNSTSITREFELHEQHKTVMKAVMANSWKAYFCPEETKGLQKIKKSVRWPEKVISDIYTWVEGEDEPEEEDEMLSEDDLRTTTSPSECVNLSISEITAATQTARLHAPYTTLADDEDPEECYLADDETSTRFLTSSNITILSVSSDPNSFRARFTPKNDISTRDLLHSAWEHERRNMNSAWYSNNFQYLLAPPEEPFDGTLLGLVKSVAPKTVTAYATATVDKVSAAVKVVKDVREGGVSGIVDKALKWAWGRGALENEVERTGLKGVSTPIVKQFVNVVRDGARTSVTGM